MISGNSVKSATSITSRPASRSRRAVPPVDSISTLAATSVLASSTSPVLSETDKRARRMGIGALTFMINVPILHD